MKKVFLILSIAAFSFSCHKHTSVTSSTVNKGPAEDKISAPQADNKIEAEKKESKTETVTKTESLSESAKTESIKWLSYEEAVKEAKKKPKKIFIDVYTDWCGWCKKMEKTTLQDPKITAYMNKNYYAVKLNAESNKEIVFQGKKITEKQLAADVFKITGYPTTVYLESNEKLIQPIPGFMDAVNLDKILHYIGEDHYKTQTWEQFQMSYK